MKTALNKTNKIICYTLNVNVVVTKNRYTLQQKTHTIIVLPVDVEPFEQDLGVSYDVTLYFLCQDKLTKMRLVSSKMYTNCVARQNLLISKNHG